MEIKTKAETFIGFALRTGKYKMGMNASATLKRASLMLVCESGTENTFKETVKLSRRLGCRLFVTNGKKLENYVHKDGIKVLTVTDKKLAQAIIDNSGNEFIERIGE